MDIEERYNLILDPDNLDPWAGAPTTRDAWKAGIRRELRKIETTAVGSLLLRGIKYHGRWVKIIPMWWAGDPALASSCNASAIPWLIQGSKPVFSVIRISPERYREGSSCAMRHAAQGGTASEAHEILFHELVHAFRQASRAEDGTIDIPTPLTGGLLAHSNSEEFIAVLVSNIYASANGKKALRAAHRGHRVMPDDLEGSFKFFQIGSQAFGLVDAFCKSNKGFCGALSTVKAPFNPIRAYYHDRERARRASESRRAASRDLRGLVIDYLEDVMPLFHASDFERLMKDA